MQDKGSGRVMCILVYYKPNHLLIETPDGNLSQAMRDINGNYTQKFNAHHSLADPFLKLCTNRA